MVKSGAEREGADQVTNTLHGVGDGQVWRAISRTATEVTDAAKSRVAVAVL